MKARTTNGPAAIWGWPIAIAVITATGLVAALLLEGFVAKAAACLALAVPAAVIGVCMVRTRR